MADVRAAQVLGLGWLAGLLIGLAAVGGPSTAQAPTGETVQQEEPATVEPEGPERVGYEVAIEGPLGEGLRSLLEEVSEMRRLADRPPVSITRLRRRAQDDRDRLLQALRSRGYYDADIEISLERDTEPVRVVFEVDPGPVYRIRDVELRVEPPDPDLRVPSPEDLGVGAGQVAAAQRVLDAEAAFLRGARAQGFALAELGEREAVVDHDADSMDLTLVLRPGPRARFGDIRVGGLAQVRENFVRKRLPWEPGDLITPELLAEGRQSLLTTGLFSTVRLRLDETVDEQDELPVTVELRERRHRSIEVGVRYRTDEGPGGNVAWEHRNLFGAGEQLRFSLDGSGIGYSLSSEFRKPDVLARDQTLVVGASTSLEDTDAYESASVGASVGFERILQPGVTGALGVAYRFASIEQQGDTESFALLSLPATLAVDRSDDLLNPTAGWRLTFGNEPFVDTLGNDVVFNKSRVDHSHYLKLRHEPDIVLAGRVSFGTLFGAARDQVPADERFYAGGGGSVRGFGFQMAGELDDDGDPVGGRSLLELSGEVRTRLTETVGGVLFVDAGSAFESEIPDFDPDLRIGAGVGVRYFSPIGPLRLDVGFPINRRSSDDAFQLYISLGQAF